MGRTVIAVPPVRRALFVATILTGSFLLFLIQPMVARMALPQLGGAPNVWNSAMLVYQALLLGGYAYAHWLGRFTVARQAAIHLVLFALAAFTLPIALAELPPSVPGLEALWVPLLFLVSIGPVFFLVSAQAPLMQRWFAAHPDAGEPWALYAASNLGSFAGLLAFPLLVEPELPLRVQSLGWSLGYGLLALLIALCALARRGVRAQAAQAAAAAGPAPGVRRILLWLALAAVPSGLMLSTTTHLTTDLIAMPLLWVIPLGIYLFSFVIAFAENRLAARVVSVLAPAAMLAAGGLAMVSRGQAGLVPVLAGVVLLFFVCTALHARLYDLRPGAGRLTQFYLVMSAGGAIGGLFTALIAPLVFDWVWEHPLLVLAAALLLPLPALFDWRRLGGMTPEVVNSGVVVVVCFALFLAWLLYDGLAPGDALRHVVLFGAVLCGLALAPWRLLFAGVLGVLMLVQGGVDTIETSLKGLRQRSYFGIYTLRDYPQSQQRTLAHGTTLHGTQSTDPALRLTPISYYGEGSGAAIVIGGAQQLFGPAARIGVLGLGAGSLACFNRPGESWTFFEIDPAVLAYSTRRDFTFLSDCAPQARVEMGDARLTLARAAPASFDVLAMDAFSSDSVPLHLLTREAFGTYLRALSPRGVLLVHISNRYLELEPAVAAVARSHGLAAMIRDDNPANRKFYAPSSFVVLSRDPAMLDRVRALSPQHAFRPLMAPSPSIWSDDHASILPYIRWEHLLGPR